MSEIVKIRVRKGFSDGTLRLKRKILFFNVIKAFDVKVERKDTIHWINESDEVKSIKSIEPKAGYTNDIFSVPPHSQGNTWTAEIKYNAAPDRKNEYVIYEYLIRWEDKDGNTRVFDPKLTLKPSGGGVF